jgi:hypothetical protein
MNAEPSIPSLRVSIDHNELILLTLIRFFCFFTDDGAMLRSAELPVA